MTANAEIIEAREVLGAQAMLGEGSIWHQESRSLLWLDILR
jgi:sugar lactone lactonase YvrE